MEMRTELMLPHDYDTLILNNLTVTKLLDTLSTEERDLIRLWMSNSFTLEEVGRIIGQKYHGEDIKSSVIRYRRNKIIKKLRKLYDKPLS